MPYFDRLSGLKRWAAGGGVSEPSDAQANQGFAYLANGKPTVEGFNALFQGNDDAHNWLFKGFRGILTRAGMAPVENDEFQIANALRVLATRPWWYESTAGSKTYIVPANVTVLFVLVVGGGGGSSGVDNGCAQGRSGRRRRRRRVRPRQRRPRPDDRRHGGSGGQRPALTCHNTLPLAEPRRSAPS